MPLNSISAAKLLNGISGVKKYYFDYFKDINNKITMGSNDSSLGDIPRRLESRLSKGYLHYKKPRVTQGFTDGTMGKGKVIFTHNEIRILMFFYNFWKFCKPDLFIIISQDCKVLFKEY